jgi:cell division protein FtsW
MDPSIYRLRLRDILTLCVLGLLLLGVLIVQSAASRVTGDTAWSWNSTGTKHLVFVILSLGTFFAVGHLDYRTLLRRPKITLANPIIWIFAIALITSGLTLVPHIGKQINGARRWLAVGPVFLQPSELAKWAVVTFLAWWLSHRPLNIERFGNFLLTLIPITAICLLVVIQDFGTAALIAGVALFMLIAGRVKWWHLMLVIPPAMAAGFWFVHHKAYRWQRMTSFTHPFADPKGEGDHMIQSLLSFATGGIFGRGLGNGIQKLGYLPEDTTDFIFSVICEELGIFGALLTIALYLGILFVAWQAIKEKRDSFGRLLAFGIAAMVCTQALINIAVATVSVPTKGLSLPLVSAGGSGLVITCGALGLLYSITRHTHEEETAPVALPLPLAA